MVEVLGPDRILNAHSKDVVVEPRLVTHIDEATIARMLGGNAAEQFGVNLIQKVTA